MRYFVLCFISLFSFALAQPTCVQLIKAWEDATATAVSYQDTVSVTQGEREVFYQEGFSSRSGEDWDRTVNVERSALPFDMPGGPGENDREEEDEGPEAFCEGATVEPQGEAWLIRPADDPKSPIQNSTLLFETSDERLVPTLIKGDFDLKFLLVPFKGSFSTAFHDWRFSLEYTDPRDR